MFRYTFVFLSLSFFAATAQSAWDEKFYNPQPLADDVILPLPCEGSMAFRIVKTNTHKPLEDTSITLGGNRQQDGYAEYATPNYITGGFTDKHNERYFLLAKYEITDAQYQSVMTEKCPTPNMKGLLPITNISWFDAITFTQKYNEWLLKNAKDKLPVTDDGTAGFIRLPTNVEWEFASRGGVAVTPSEFREITFPMKGNLAEYAWFNNAKSANGRLQVIGRLKPNPIGLFDTLGNASEMMFDSFKLNKLNRYHGQDGGITVRGGSYLKSESDVNNISRLEIPYYDKNGVKKAKDIGFRVAIVAPLLTSSEHIKQLQTEWEALGQDNKKNNNQAEGAEIVNKLAALANTTVDEKLKKELNNTKEQLRAANLERDEQRDAAIRSALQLGAFLCANVSDLDGEVEQNRKIAEAMTSLYPNTEKETAAKARLTESEQARDFVLKYYADTIVGSSATYNKQTIESQVERANTIVNSSGKANLVKYVALYWKHLAQYYQDGKITRQQWLENCTHIKQEK
ncbi:sulfatase [Gallibacterium genomosp. 3]|uniref:Sulfatase n=1 Tax=Gallibacterium genomosp. 3 TaxID=505345 RepID=A0A1A7NN78_9PAST|nr:SUMF1/EgtB/PvdO family nonheme iron enzyme [Gallibacterium genomosp. 3]OBW91065.1 sulfatase [Gallibacterium genomosp. 3]